MKNIRIYICDSSIDGIFTAIYCAWESKFGHNNIKIMEDDNYNDMELFSEYITVGSDSEKALKVARSIKNKISEEAYSMVCKSAVSKEPGRADAIYRFLIMGFSVGKKVTEDLSHPLVYPLFKMERNVNNEMLHYLGFLRFSELKNKVLFSKIDPQNNIILLIADHFAERLSEENWLIYDVGRKVAVVHKKAQPWFFTDASDLNLSAVEDYSEEEIYMQAFWKKFVDTIAIKERTNVGLQKQMLPNRFREFMREVPYIK